MNLDPISTEELSRKILLHSRRLISLIAPTLLEAIYALHEQACSLPGPLSTDGRTLWFHPDTVVEDFRKDRDSVARQLLHVTNHCLLGHLELRSSFPDSRPFDCAADLKAAQLANGLCGGTFATHPSRDIFLDFDNVTHLLPLCKSLQSTDHQGDRLRRIAGCTYFDDHDLWDSPILAASAPPGCSSDEGDERAPSAPTASDGEDGESDRSDAPDWDRIRQSMLDSSLGKLPGTCAGLLMENFSVHERGMSFSAFLRRFTCLEERMLPDPDSFDVRWYHLGMEYYGNIPLLEPSEISEPPLPDDLVVALDVSGSCHGETCHRFLKELLGLLRDISAGAARFRVLLLLCDTKIQKELLLETPEQVDALFADFTITGFGGTDFRPVFDRIAHLRRDGSLPRVQGLLYLTDSYGTYPDHPTDYPTAFLIPNEDRDYLPTGTEWITRLYLNEHDFTLKEATT